MIAVPTNNKDYQTTERSEHIIERISPFDSSERPVAGKRLMAGIKSAENEKQSDTGKESSNKISPKDETTPENRRPHDLPPVVHTNSSEQSESMETNSRDLLSPSFDDDLAEKDDAFPVETVGFSPMMVGAPLTSVSISETEASTPSVKDMIKFFGSPARRSNQEEHGPSNNSNNNRRLSCGSSNSAVSRHTDAPFATPRFNQNNHYDDDSLGDYSVTSMPAFYEPHGSPSRNKTKSELDMLREQSIVSSRRRLQNRSAARRDRLHYKLGSGRKGMTQKDISRSRTFLPADKLIEMKQEQPPKSSPENELYVWLLSPANKVFEVVRVPLESDTTIGDVLGAARAAALDPVLAEQRYVSLCNERLELVAPLLPVKFLFDTRISKNKSQSLMAVPEGCTALVVREIHKVLTGNRRVRKWLDQKDIFRPMSEEEKAQKRRERRAKRERKKKEAMAQK